MKRVTTHKEDLEIRLRKIRDVKASLALDLKQGLILLCDYVEELYKIQQQEEKLKQYEML